MQGIALFSFIIIGGASLYAIGRRVNTSAHRSVEIKLYIHCAIVSAIKLNFFVYGVGYSTFKLERLSLKLN